MNLNTRIGFLIVSGHNYFDKNSYCNIAAKWEEYEDGGT